MYFSGTDQNNAKSEIGEKNKVQVSYIQLRKLNQTVRRFCKTERNTQFPRNAEIMFLELFCNGIDVKSQQNACLSCDQFVNIILERQWYFQPVETDTVQTHWLSRSTAGNFCRRNLVIKQLKCGRPSCGLQISTSRLSRYQPHLPGSSADVNNPWEP